MTDVVYNIELPLKEFPVSYTGLKTWLDSNVTNCAGFSVDSSVRVHMTTGSDETVITAVNNYWDGLTDDGVATAEAAKARSLMIEEAKIQYGIKVKAYLGYLCEVNNFTPTQYGQMIADSDLSLANVLLLNGALETVKGIVDSYTPTAYFTSDMQSALSAELQKYITMVASL